MCVYIIRVRTVMENLKETSNFQMIISRPGKVLGKFMDTSYVH